ncbi:protein kinase domain-containing protein [Thalassoroseus pseudoceratinae]|uniref:protein kinase domain-containing protein n=1 Tax=Thalassoroseus pseudoceratinae TaxID=2713176 RepID=UPI001421BB61|nr:protein kinase [Thalassoroseus pseudoceratinae]
MTRACPTRDEWTLFLKQSPLESVDFELSNHLEGCQSCSEVVEELCENDALRGYADHQSSRVRIANSSDWRFVRTRLIAAGNTSLSDIDLEEAVFIEEEPPESLGRFQLIRKLGEGAHGVVYLAKDTVIKRTVALKLPRHTALTDPNRRNSFVKEAQASGSLQHPNIVSIHEAGEIDGVCYLAAAYVDGQTLAEWLENEKHPIPPRTAAQIIAVLADAVQHAHQSNIIHRDLKPTNILIDTKVPSADLAFRPQITDFGLAKILDVEEQTRTATGVIKGTVAYMAPEQIQQKDVGPHTDIFALGTILYELLTRRTPFQSDSLSQTLRSVLDDPPTPPKRLAPSVPRDLQAICLKCLEKRPQDRYASASELRDDLVRYCNGEVVTANATSPIVSAWRWAKRRPSWAALLLTVILALSAGVLGLSLHVRQLAKVNTSLKVVTGELADALKEASVARAQAEDSEQSARQFALQSQRMSYSSDMQLAARSWRDGEIRQVRSVLDRHISQGTQPDLRGLEWNYLDYAISLPSDLVMQLSASIYWITWSPNEEQVAICGSDGIVRIINAETFQVEQIFETQQGELNCVVYSPDGQFLASSGDDGTVKVYDLQDGSIKTLQAHDGLAFGLVFTPDGESLFSCGTDSRIVRWNTKTWKSSHTFKGHVARVEAIAVSPNGRWLASSSYDHRVGIWDLETNENVELLRPIPAHHIFSVAFSSDSRFLAIGSRSGNFEIRDTTRWERLIRMPTADPVQRVQFLPDGSKLVTADSVGVLRLWEMGTDADTGAPNLSLLRAWWSESDRIYATALGKQGQTLWTGSEDGKLRVWDLSSSPLHQNTNTPGIDVDYVSMIGPDEALISSRQSLYRWKPSRPNEYQTVVEGRGPWLKIAVSRNRKHYAVGNSQGELYIWRDGQESPHVRPSEKWPFGFPRAFSQDGKRLVFTECPTTLDTGRMHLLDTGTDESIWSCENVGPGNGVCFSPNGQYLIYSVGHRVYARDLETEENIALANVHTQTVRWIDFSPDDIHFATASEDGTCCLWNSKDFHRVHRFSTHAHAIRGGQFGPDGRTLSTIDALGILKMYQVESGQELLELDIQHRNGGGLISTNNGQALLTYCMKRDRLCVIPFRWPR